MPQQKSFTLVDESGKQLGTSGFKLVDESGNPLDGQPLSIPLPSGSIGPKPSLATELYRSGKDYAGQGLTGLRDIFAGVGSGIANTGLGISKVLGSVPRGTTLEDIGMAPEGTLQKVGMGAEQAGE